MTFDHKGRLYSLLTDTATIVINWLSDVLAPRYSNLLKYIDFVDLSGTLWLLNSGLLAPVSRSSGIPKTLGDGTMVS